MNPGEPKPNQVKPNGNVMEYIPVDIRLKEARADEKRWHEEIGKIQEKQSELALYDFYTEKAQEKVNQLDKYETKFEKFLDDPVIIDPKKGVGEMFAFKDMDEYASSELIYKTGIYELGASVLKYYAASKNPQRQFEISEKTETTLRDLFENFRMFLNNQFTIPKPTEQEIQKNQEEVNEVWANYRKAQEEVKKLESTITN